MPASRKPRHRQRQTIVRVPMMRPLKQQISDDMHLALFVLRTAPHDDARTDLAATFNTVSVAIENDARFAEERAHLLAGALCLQDYTAPAALTDQQLATLAHTCSVIDTILGLFDVATLWAAEKTAVALARQARAASTKGADTCAPR
ncbi:hypothetical protein [Orrella dioscoreae]|nr:hypothetical protein [Orrella dioscoreae]